MLTLYNYDTESTPSAKAVRDCVSRSRTSIQREGGSTAQHQPRTKNILYLPVFTMKQGQCMIYTVVRVSGALRVWMFMIKALF